ncbi:hypothetical protein BHOIPH791_12070 [Bartonella henselae]|uniref:Uncharacterized protein n=2 Tax=Bartonella henselae TaxID=38323 RepID=X5M587_BARHN|nr:DUF2853 family protein [Bartonella henselae]ATP12596.1 hypothetical protein BhenCHDE101_05615 [Bartonella henselae]ETS08211.1 hypothetical protein Q654_01083 [Bartonella henselae JK 50]ETS08759.1 hypothetical protein Q655_01036 [Bartonella henselae JK 51]ETS11311.1 hypothetical protein Q653_00232 [Bartonella henselae JK 42]ETS15316.1 hypothetical protein Q652_00364 [Bartonella henselae JK 41]
MTNDLADIKLYDQNPDEAAIERLHHRLALVMKNQDASLVATSDPKELERVEKWVQDVLGADEQSAKRGVSKVADMMSGDRRKSRMTFYYLVAKQLNALHKI